MASQYSFSGHETFPLRLMWLKKAIDAIDDNRMVFQSDAAIAKFGVGKNMVHAIRHWGLAADMIEADPDAEERNALRVSELGGYLLGENGVDPYCEDAATLWLLHWLLCRSPDRATLWHFIFGHWRGGGIELRSLQPVLEKWLDERDSQMPSDSTLHRDLQCLLNTYVVRYRTHTHLESTVEFPLASLGLLYENRGLIYLREGQQRSLPPEIFAYAVLDYWDRNFNETETLSAQNILTHRASPGQIFLLSEEQAYELVSRIEAFEETPFRFDTTAGIHQFYRSPRSTPLSMLERYYVHSLHAIT
ncbi:MAG: DUF4007 family protein [Rhodothermaceae bacterium]|nr:DUF4007 family protein [Rhodothermaceae bacterium]MYF39853.1 DUF4007 family protein [Rhodothermaceae bacterium]